MSVRQEQKAATRRRLLGHAERLVIRNGFATTRTIDVARAAGVAHGSVFVHFPSREDLMLSVASEMGRRLTDRLHELAAAGTGLRPALTAHVGCIAEHEDLYHRLLVEGPSRPTSLPPPKWTSMPDGSDRYRLTCCSTPGSGWSITTWRTGISSLQPGRVAGLRRATPTSRPTAPSWPRTDPPWSSTTSTCYPREGVGDDDRTRW